MNYHKLLQCLAAGALFSTAAAQAAVTIPGDFAYPLNSVSSANRGFTVRVNQASRTSGELANSLARTESQLAGTLVNPVTGQLYTNIIDRSTATFNADGSYTETTTIDYEKGGGSATGKMIPGIPGLEQNSDNIALEALAYLELQPGTYTMTVNSDDGFRVTTGKDARDKFSAITLGFYDGGRGAGDTSFDFTVTAAGVYPFRLIYEQGGGGANVSWYAVAQGAADPKVLVNDAGGIKAYSKVSAATPPYLSVLIPAPGADKVSPGIVVTAVINDGSANKIVPASVKLSFDNAVVAPTVTQTNGGTRVTYAPPTLLDPASTHKVKLVYSDDASPAVTRTNEYTFVTSATGNIILPTPIWLENFDSTTQGKLPAGWSVLNYTSGSQGVFDLDDPNSDSYLDWVVISKDQVLAVGALGRWDSTRRLNTPEQFVNGKAITSLVNGNFLYAESDNRGGSQIQYAFSPDINLTGKTNIYLSFHSIYEQNQDSLGAVEYSIDKGNTWLPILYMLDGPDIVLDANGKPDGYATMIATNGDTARYDDPVTGESLGLNYGAFIGVKSNEWKNIGPFISARVNDDPNESKRVELFRLPKADGQATVRLRFAQAGTGSWYFGIDDVGFYSINNVAKPLIAASPASLNLIAGGKATFTVDARGEQLSYQWQLNSNNIAGATNTSYTIASTKLSDSGTYRVIVTNPGGSLTSADAVLKVSSPLSDPTVLATGLVAYLPFDGDYTDVKGNVSAKAVGSPNFEAGVRGQGIHVKNLKDGSLNNYVTLGYPNALKFGDSKDFTVSFWVKQNSQADDQALISNKDWNSSNNRGWGVFTQGGNVIRVQITGPGAATDKLSYKPVANLDNKAWHLVTVSVGRSTGNVDTFVDGVLSASSAITTKGNIDTDDLGFAFNLGQDGTGKYTDGNAAELDAVIDELAVWNRTLNSQEAQALYALGNASQSILVPALTQDLQVYLPFDGDYADKSGKSVAASAVGSPTFETAVIGKGVHIKNLKDGSLNNYVTLGYPAGLKFGDTGSFTVSFWVKLNSQADDQAFISNKDWNSSNNRGWGIFSQGGNVIRNQFTGPGGSADKASLKPAIGIADAQWHLLTVATDRAAGKSATYFDGSLVQADTISTKGSFDTDDLGMAINIGQDGTGKYTDGGSAEIDAVIDDLAIWTRPLAGVEVAAIYSKGVAGAALLSQPVAPATAAKLTASLSGGNLNISWTGSGSFKVQKKNSLSDTTWTDVTTTTSTSASVPVSGNSGFFRVVSQ